MNRRKFLHQSSCAAVGTSTLLSSLINMKAIGAASIANSQTSNDYKALVCILLSGGNDSFNMLVPYDTGSYREYRNARSNNAIDRNSLIQIDPVANNSRSYGLHPSLPNLAQMFNQGQLSFLANIGTLIEPLTLDQYYSESMEIPLALFSHNDQVQQWQTAIPQDRSSVGWLGKISELISDMNGNQNLSMGVSMSGSNFIQTGTNSVPYTMIPGEGPAGIYEWEDQDTERALRNNAVQSFVEQQYSDAFQATYISTIKKSIDSFEQYKDAFERTRGQLSNISFPYDEWQFGQSLRTVADTIVARNVLDLQRQTFFVEFGGWDHHDELVNSHAEQLSVVDRSIKSFYDGLERIGIADNVVTFIISEFGRPLVSNGNGTDHAWGGNVFVVGGPNTVNGQRIFGRYPDLNLNDKSDIGGGIFVPDISADEYFAELALWFGVPAQDLPIILPNIRNFYNINSGDKPIGFLNY